MAAIFQRGKTWWVRYSVNGTQCRESLNTTSEKVARRKLARYEEALDAGTFQPPSKTFLETFLERYYQNLKQTRPEKSFINEKNRLEHFFKQTRVKTIEELTPTVIADYLDEMAAVSKKGRWKPNTYNRYREALAGMFDYALERCGFVSRDPRHPNPARGVTRRKIRRHEIIYIRENNIPDFLHSMAGYPRMQTHVAMLIFAGLRREESLWLRKSDVDLAAREIRICAKTDAWSEKTWTPKTNADRCVPISSNLMAFLENYESPAESEWYFPSPQGLLWHPDNFSQELTRIQCLLKLGRQVGTKIKPYGCNIFRHTFATMLAMRGKSLTQIARAMGNSVPIVEKHYAAFISGNREMHEAMEMDIDMDASPENTDKKATKAKVICLNDYLRDKDKNTRMDKASPDCSG